MDQLDQNLRNDNENENTNYIDALAKAKQLIDTLNQSNQKLKDDNKQLVQTMMNNGTIEDQQPADTRTTKDMAYEFLNNANLTNRDKIQLALDYRNKVIDEQGPDKDPFVNQYSKDVSRADYLDAQFIADGLQAALDSTETPEEFNMELNRIMKN